MTALYYVVGALLIAVGGVLAKLALHRRKNDAGRNDLRQR